MPRGALWVLAALGAACASEPSHTRGARPGPSPSPESESDTEVRAPTPRPDSEARGPRPDSEARGPTPSPDSEARGPTPSPEVRAASPSPSPTPDAGAPTAETTVPPENRDRGTRPDDSTAIEGARRLLEAIQRDDPAIAADFFFPGPAFDLVKAMAVPARYFRRLFAWYGQDVHAEHARFRDVQELLFDRFQMGRCVWQEIGTEGNALPYWSCRHNLLFARSATRTRSFGINVLINWGPRWYITHLGEIRR